MDAGVNLLCLKHERTQSLTALMYRGYMFTGCFMYLIKSRDHHVTATMIAKAHVR